MDSIPLGVLFIVTIIILFIAMELGYRAGNTHAEHAKKDKEKITSSNANVVLSMLGFFLIFTFGIVYSRFDSKKELVREDANLIRTAWLRSDFLPEQDREAASDLFKRYIDLLIDVAESRDFDKVDLTLNELKNIQNQLWNMAVVNARKDMNSDVAALYIESLNEIINQQALRVAVGLQARIPEAIWILLYLLIFMGMFAMGYEASVAGSSKKSWLTPIMVLSFSLIIILIASLDRPDSSIIRVTQQPIIDLRNWKAHN